MKISRNQLRNVINEAIQDKFQDPTDDPRFSDTSYSGRPGSYTYEDDDNDRELTGINVQLPFYQEKGHFLWKGKQLLLSDFDGDELAMGKFVEAIIAHADSQLSHLPLMPPMTMTMKAQMKIMTIMTIVKVILAQICFLDNKGKYD